MSNITTGVTLVVSTEGIEEKLNRAASAVQKTLSKSQMAIDMAIDSMGRYVNKQGQVVEGLTLAQIKQGQYVDELARVRTANGGYVADLTKIEQALGFYADAHGDVFDAQDNLIRKTKEAQKALEDEARAEEEAARAQIKAEKEKAEALEKEAQKQKQIEKELADEAERRSKEQSDAWAESARAFSEMTGRFAIFLATFDQGDGISRTFVNLSNSVSTASASIETMLKFSKAVAPTLNGWNAAALRIINSNKLAAVSTTAVGTASVASAAKIKLAGVAAKATAASMKALQFAAGPLGLILTAVATGIYAFMKSSGTANYEVPELSDSFKTLEERAKSAGDAIRNVGDALKYGAFYDVGSKLEESAKKVEETHENFLKVAGKHIGEYNGKTGKERVRSYEENGKDLDLIAKEATGMRGDKVKAEVDKATAAYKESMAEYNAIVEDLVNKAREEQKTATDRLNEERQAYETVKKHAEEQLKNAETDEERRKIDEKVALIDNQLKLIDGKIADEKKKELEAEQKKQEAAQKALLDELGIGQYLNKQKTDAEDLQKAQARWKDAVEKNAITSEQYQEAMRNALAKRLGISFEVSKPVDPFEELKKYKDELGDAYQVGLEQLQKKFADELDRSSATLDKWNEALKERKVSQEDFNKAAEKIKEATLSQYGVSIVPKNDDAITQFSEGKAALQKLFDSHQLSQSEYDDAMSQLSARVKEMFPAEEKTALQAAQEEYEKALDTVKRAFEAGALSEEERQKMIDAAEKRLAEAKDAEAKAARDSIRSTLGVDQLMESLKSPLEKYRETMDKIDQAVAQNAVSSEESAALVAKAEDDYWAAMKETNGAMSKIQDAAGKIGAAELGKSMSSGSEELYLAQVRNSNSNYQSRMQNSVEGMGGVLRENLVQTQLMAGYLQTMSEGGTFATFG